MAGSVLLLAGSTTPQHLDSGLGPADCSRGRGQRLSQPGGPGPVPLALTAASCPAGGLCAPELGPTAPDWPTAVFSYSAFLTQALGTTPLSQEYRAFPEGTSSTGDAGLTPVTSNAMHAISVTVGYNPALQRNPLRPFIR